MKCGIGYGFRLGSAVDSIQSGQAYVQGDPKRRLWLDHMEFVWNEFVRRQWEVSEGRK
jgi:hypothetical protein